MGILDGLALGAISGAGTAIQENSLRNQQADLDVQKAQTIAEKTAALADQQRQDHAKDFMSAATENANTKKQGLLNSVGAESPDELSKDHLNQYNGITAYSPDVIKETGLQTGYIRPEEAIKNDLTAEKMQNQKDYYQGKLENASTLNDIKLRQAEIHAAIAGNSHAENLVLMNGIKQESDEVGRDLRQEKKDKEAFLSDPLNNSLKKQLDPEALKSDPNSKRTLYDKRLGEFDSNIDHYNNRLASNSLIIHSAAQRLGLEQNKPNVASPKTTAFGDLSK